MDVRRTKATGRILRSMLLPIFTGLCLSQLVATIAVHQSNQRIYALAKAIEAEGYLSIPTGPALQTLTQFGSAVWGGLFFTLSIGTGLTLATWAATFLWCRVLGRNPKVLIACGAVWIALLVAINSSGAVWLPSLFCLLIPPVTAWATARGMKQHKESSNLQWATPLATLVMLTLLWTTQNNSDLFVTIRDHILLSNPIGHKINDFYYRNTLYAAEVIKTFNNKTIRTYRWEGSTDAAMKQLIDKRLGPHNMLQLNGNITPDVVLTHGKGLLIMTSADGRRLQASPSQFMAAPSEWLSQYSELTDRLTPFRLMTFYGLKFGFPILLFATFYGGLRVAAGMLLQEKKAVFAASGCCMAIGIVLLVPMLKARPVQMTRDNIATALEANNWPERVAALRYIEQQKIDIARYPQYRSLVKSPLVVERYWLARAMATSRSLSTHYQLTALIQDPHPNVVCQAYYALGQRRSASAINPILRQLKTSDHWYTQWYGYRALRRVGWRQTRSN